MSGNPWLSIPLEDYESHMSDVNQLEALSELFRDALERCRPRSVAILGIAGGNGLEHVDSAVTTRVVGIDINNKYLRKVAQRFGHIPGLDLHEVDLAIERPPVEPVDLVHAALIFEHATCIPNAVSMVAPEGQLSVVLQKRATTIRWYGLGETMTFFDPEELCEQVPGTLIHERRYAVLNECFWHGIFRIPREP